MLRPNAVTSIVERQNRSGLANWLPARSRVTLGGIAVLLAALPSGTAWAAEPTPKAYPACVTNADEANVQAARGAFEAGKAAFIETDYPRAILYWEDAFRRDCSAVLLLKNLTRAYEANGQYAEAVVALRTYLEREPAAEDRAELEAHLRELEGKLDDAATAPSGLASSGGESPGATGTTAADSQTHGDGSWERRTSPSDGAGSRRPGSAHRTGAAVVTGVGAAVGVTGLALWFAASADEKAANDECPTRMGCPAEVTARGNEAIDRKQRWAIVGAGGGALVVGGVLWFLLAPSDNGHGFTPTVSPSFAGAHWSTSF